MTRLVHLTDLHFGAERAELVAPLRAAVLRCDPDFVIVSGDLSQRARIGQFRRAMQFIDSLQRPYMVVPGNHDIPLYNLPLRWISPFFSWKMSIPQGRGCFARVGPIRLFGVNSADPGQWRGGVLRDSDVARVEAALRGTEQGGGAEAEALNLLVCHHPLEEPPGFERGETRGAESGIARLAAAGLHGVVSGHLHHWQLGLGIAAGSPRPLLQIQTGTALCGRKGEKDHGFTLLDQQPGGLIATPFVINETTLRFEPGPQRQFRREGGLWHLL